MSALPRPATPMHLVPRPPSHATIRDLIRHGYDINLEDMCEYLGLLLDKMSPSSQPQRFIVADMLEKTINGIQDCLAEEQAELPQD